MYMHIFIAYIWSSAETRLLFTMFGKLVLCSRHIPQTPIYSDVHRVHIPKNTRNAIDHSPTTVGGATHRIIQMFIRPVITVILPTHYGGM